MKSPRIRIARAGLIIAGASVLLIVGLFLYVQLGPRATPSGQPPMIRLSPGNFHLLIERFNSESGSRRVLVMLSPS
jgi:hypothetical protein